MQDAQVQECVAANSIYDDAVLLAALKIVLEERPSVIQELTDWAVPDRAYAAARLLQENRCTGVIKSFNEKHGYGFIDAPEVKEAFGFDVFLHHRQKAGWEVGTEVSFGILLNNERKPQAFDLAIPGQEHVKGGGGKGAGAGAKGAGGGAKGPGSSDPWGSYSAWGASAAPGKGAVTAAVAWSPKGATPYTAAKAGKGSAGGKAAKKPATSRGAPMSADASVMEAMIMDRRFEGHIKSFVEKNGFGFLECADITEMFGNDCFMHKNVFAGFEVGQAVSFSVFLKDGKPQAKDMEATGGPPAAKRARAW